MALAKRFEDLEVWKKGCRLSCEIFKLAEKGPLSRTFVLRDQMCGSALSIPSNVAEGFERGSRRAFASFLRIAKGSAGELRTQTYIAARLDYITRKKSAEIVAMTTEISKMLGSLIASLRATR